jgi:opacity protein-like surface antigen
LELRIDLEKVKLGLSINAGFYSDNDNEDNGFDNVDVSIFAFQPRAFAEFYLEEDSKFRPRLGLGYSSLRFKLNELPQNFSGQLEDSDTRGGFNINLGVGFYFSPKVFAILQYDFIKLSNDTGLPDSAFNQNVNLLKIGVGYQF